MPLYREKSSGLLLMSDDMALLDTGDYTLPQFASESMSDDKLSKVPLYDEVKKEEAMSYDVFLEWCKQEDESPNHYNVIS